MDKKRGVVALLCATTGMGLSGLLSRGATRIDLFGADLVAGQSIGACLTVGRMLTGLAMFVILLLVTRKLGLFRTTKLSPAIVLGGLSLGVSFSFYTVSVLLTSLANSVFLIYTGPLFCTLLARIFRKEPISLFQGICLAMVFVGMLLTSGIVSFGEAGVSFGLSMAAATPEFPQKGLGDLLGLMSGVFYGLSLFFNGYRKDCDTTVRGVWNFLFASLGGVVITIAMVSAWPLGEVAMQPANWGFAIAFCVICGPLALGLLLVAGRNLPAVEYSTIAYWECVVSLVASVLVFHEAMTFVSGVGGALILLGGALPAFSAFLPGKEDFRK